MFHFLQLFWIYIFLKWKSVLLSNKKRSLVALSRVVQLWLRWFWWKNESVTNLIFFCNFYWILLKLCTCRQRTLNSYPLRHQKKKKKKSNSAWFYSQNYFYLIRRWRERKHSFYLFSLPIFYVLHSLPRGWFLFCALFTVFFSVIKTLVW